MTGRRAPASLTLRLAWRLGALMLAAMAAAAAAVAWRAIVTVRDMDDAALQVAARTVAAHVRRGPAGQITVALPAALAAPFLDEEKKIIYLVFDRQGHLRASSDAVVAPSIVPFVPAHGGLFRVPGGRDGRPMLGWLEQAGPWRVAVLKDHEQSQALIRALLERFFAAALWLLGPIALGAVLVAVLTLRHGLRPLALASAAAARAGPTHPGVRLPTTGLTRELMPLVNAVNDALARLERGLDVQRRFSGEAAHALRTPLAVLTARLNALPEGPSSADLGRDVDRMARLVEQMLQMARLEGLPLDVSHRVDLHQVAVEAISNLAPLALQRGIDLALAEGTTPVAVLGNAAALVLALSNLLENALAEAPAGSVVEVEINPPARIAVLDRGPGIPPAEREAIFLRFRRGGRSASAGKSAAGSSGAGLGLAIVAEIAAQHGGSVRVEEREGGGARFVIELPAERGNG
ncbi:MAG: HAMP domain-containing sensor histidine kinase [Rhodospirillales bacterium]|nr:HAMP domain-containing sensor histidine kinase [Rhodospirillales bacterium]